VEREGKKEFSFEFGFQRQNAARIDAAFTEIADRNDVLKNSMHGRACGTRRRDCPIESNR